MKKLIIDLNSIVTSSLLVGKDEGGFKVEGQTVNTWEYGYNNFLNTYNKTLDTLGLVPMHTIGVFDASKSRERRQKIYENYKAHRRPRPKEYYKEFNFLMKKCKQFIRHLGGTIVSAERYEADDVIAHIAPKLDGVIWSKDKDLLSIGEPMYLDGLIYLGEGCEDRFLGLPRRFVRLYRTLVGDTGDFGPGTSAKGFGEKAFINLWGQFGDDGLAAMCELIKDKKLQKLVEDVGELKSLQKIIDSEEMVYTTWDLAGWLPVKDHLLKWEAGFTQGRDCKSFDEAFLDYYQSITLVTSDNFEQLLPLIQSQILECDYVPFDIETDVPEESAPWLQTIKDNISRPPITIDVLKSFITGGSITIGENFQHTYYFSVKHADTNNITPEQFKDLILNINKPIIAHNASGFELPVTFLNWGEWLPDVHCSAIAAGYVDENAPKHLKGLSMSHFHYKQESYQEVTGGKGMSELSGEHVLSYGADDTIMTGALFNFFEMVMDIEGTFQTYVETEQHCMYMIAHSFVNGIDCNLDVLVGLNASDKAEFDKSYVLLVEYLTERNWPGASFVPLESLDAKEIKRAFLMKHGKELKSRFRKLDKLAALMEDDALSEFILSGNLGGMNQYLSDNFTPNIEVKPNSPKQKTDLLYRIMQAPVRYRNQVTDKQKAMGQTEGNPSTDEDAVKWAMMDVSPEEKKVLKALLRCIAYRTRAGLYYNPYPFLTHWETGKLHPNLRQSATTSRRFAPSGPNVNQIPKRSEEGKKVRRCITPHHEDAVIISPDFSGQELRLAADITQDPNFLACYVGEDKKDLHSVTAFKISQKQGKEFETYKDFVAALKDEDHKLHSAAKSYRGVKAKPTNFLSQYVSIGGGQWMLAKKLRITEEVADEFLKAKSAAFPGVDAWKERRTKEIRKQGYAETLLGGRKHIFNLLRKGDPDHILRSAINFEIQGSGAEQTKRVLASVWLAGLMDMFDVRFYMPVHDEVCFSVARKDLIGFCKALHPLMTQDYGGMTVPIESSLAVGPNFGELTEIKWDEIGKWLGENPHYPMSDIPF